MREESQKWNMSQRIGTIKTMWSEWRNFVIPSPNKAIKRTWLTNLRPRRINRLSASCAAPTVQSKNEFAKRPLEIRIRMMFILFVCNLNISYEEFMSVHLELKDMLWFTFDFFKENLLAVLKVCSRRLSRSNLARISKTFGLFLCCKHYLTKPISF